MVRLLRLPRIDVNQVEIFGIDGVRIAAVIGRIALTFAAVIALENHARSPLADIFAESLSGPADVSAAEIDLPPRGDQAERRGVPVGELDDRINDVDAHRPDEKLG